MSNSAAILAVREPKEWKSVPGYDSYEVSDTGLLRSTKLSKEPKVLNGSVSRDGYVKYLLIGDEDPENDRLPVYASILVLELWVEERPEGMWANHIDDNPANNSLENLKWSSPKETEATRDLPEGSNRYGAKLTELQVKQMRLKKRAGMTLRALAEEYGMAKDVVWRICDGRLWKHVPMEGADVK